MTQICHNCIGERVLKAELRAEGTRVACDWCGRHARGFTAERLADRVAPVYETVVGRADEGFRQIAGRASWGPNGRSAVELMMELIEADDDALGRELIGILSNRNAWNIHEGGFDFYDEESEELDFVDASDTRLRDSWVSFCERLRHESRFFGSREALDAILHPVLAGRFTSKAVRRIVPGGPRSTLFRGRLTNDEATQRKVYAQPLAQLAAPPPGVAGAGRMNAAGISVFYGAFDVNTCLAELRVPVGGAALIGRFEVIRPLRVLDLSKLEEIQEELSYFDANYVERLSYQYFIRSFHNEIKRAVIPGRETLDYLPTQAIAEYLWTQSTPPLDGIVFGSAQISGTHRNVVLFPHACLVEGAEIEVERTVRQIFEDGPTEDDEDREAVTRVLVEPIPEQAASDTTAPEAGDDDWFTERSNLVASPNAVQPSLRMAADGMQLVTVKAIRLKSTSLQVAIEEWRDFPWL